jgi:hypothetical protein
MLVRAIKLRVAIDHFLDLEGLRYNNLVNQNAAKPLNERPATSVTRVILQNRMRSDDWAIANEIAEILEPFKDATKKLEARPNEASAIGFADVVPVLKILMENLEDFKVNYYEAYGGKPFWVAIEQAWQKAKYYYEVTDQSPAYAAAIVLDPRQKKPYLDQEWGSVWASHSMVRVKRLYHTEYEKLPLPSPPPSGEALSEVSSNRRRRRKPKYQRIDEQLEDTRKWPIPSLVQNELDAYLTDRRETDLSIVPFKYWMRPSVKAQYPKLSRMAIDLLSIPAMSAEPERIFSLAGVTLSPRRNRLTEDALEAVTCLANWGRNSLIRIGSHKQDVRGSRVISETAEENGEYLPSLFRFVDDDYGLLFEESLADSSSRNGE